ncbi:MAG: HAMP domain-containing histidine kinase [Chloroflexi bacterium]|nr:HAMP domain-containing histidine kinase [Chloroflexota bacterium]
MKKGALLWTIHPLQGLGESLLLGLLILVAAGYFDGHVDWFVFQSGLFFLCGACGMWAVLRIQIPQGGWQKQTVWELAVGLGLSLVMVVGIFNLGNLFGLDTLWRSSTWDNDAIITLLVLTGPGYFLARGGARLWLRWDRMRRERMLWSLTHAHLTVVVFFAFLAALVAFLLAPYSGTAMQIWSETEDPLSSLVTGLLVTFFPAFSLITIVMIAALAVLLPPLAIFSYFVARRTTRRLEALTATTSALRAGDYQARVVVDGEDEVARLQSDFNAMAEKLETTLVDLKSERDTVAQVLQSRRNLVANVSHELRTPVATLRAAVETTLASPSETHANLEMMEREIQRLSGLIDDLFTLSQAEVNSLRLECVPTELLPLISRVVGDFAPLAWQSGRVEVNASLPDGLSPVLVDARRLEQVLLNLLRNAARHTPPGGIVVVLAENESETVRIEVRDTGEGIDPADLTHIWERFYRGRNATSESVGLGLALSRELVEAMGGSVGAESMPGKGSCFTVHLPKA